MDPKFSVFHCIGNQTDHHLLTPSCIISINIYLGSELDINPSSQQPCEEPEHITIHFHLAQISIYCIAVSHVECPWNPIGFNQYLFTKTTYETRQFILTTWRLTRLPFLPWRWIITQIFLSNSSIECKYKQDWWVHHWRDQSGISSHCWCEVQEPPPCSWVTMVQQEKFKSPTDLLAHAQYFPWLNSVFTYSINKMHHVRYLHKADSLFSFLVSDKIVHLFQRPKAGRMYFSPTWKNRIILVPFNWKGFRSWSWDFKWAKNHVTYLLHTKTMLCLHYKGC